MKSLKFLALIAVISLAMSCKDTKKQEEEQVQKAVQTIDSVQTAIEESAQSINNAADQVQEAIKELDSI